MRSVQPRRTGLGTHGSVAARRTGTIRTAAFTLTRNVNGTATLTLNTEVLSEPSTLQNDLAQYGIRAKVTIGSWCFSDPAPAGFSQVVTSSGDKLKKITFTINPAAMPAGTELSRQIAAAQRPGRAVRAHRHQRLHLHQNRAEQPIARRHRRHRQADSTSVVMIASGMKAAFGVMLRKPLGLEAGLAVIDGCGHYVSEERPDELADLLLGFFDQRPRS